VARAYLIQLEAVSELLNAARLELLEVARTFPAFELLQTVPHVGEIRAAELIAIIGMPGRFKSRRQFWSYAALGLIQMTSAEHRVTNGEVVRAERTRSVRLAKTGQPLLKKILRDMALFASVGRGIFRDVYEAHVARGLKPSIARLSLARKIAAVIRAVWRSGKPFDATLVHRPA
jgi:Transposase IS116/IS110/IS902 family.